MGTSFAQVLDRSVDRAGSDARGITDPEGIFVHVEFPGIDIEPRGWKLHVSATPFNAARVLEACLDRLIDTRVPFKFAASLDRLIELNEGAGGLGQVGKFITVYPPSADVAVTIARALDEATAGERGPSVLTDRALSPTSLVHYRYAGFVEGVDLTPDEAPDDPFVAAGLVDDRSQMVVGSRYLITATLHKAIRGAIQLAVDTKEKRSVILKRAWRDALMTPDGRDARDRLRDEAQLLQRLQEEYFPQVFDVFEDFGDLFVAMELVEGTTLARAVHEGDAELDVLKFGRDLAAALRVMHEAGYVHRDLNPANVMVGSSMKLIDLELARPIGTSTEYAAGTEGYLSYNQQRGGPAAIGDDLYGLGCLMFFTATGEDPKPGLTKAEVEERLQSQPGPVAEVIGGLLDEDTPSLRSAGDVLALLATTPTR